MKPVPERPAENPYWGRAARSSDLRSSPRASASLLSLTSGSTSRARSWLSRATAVLYSASRARVCTAISSRRAAASFSCASARTRSARADSSSAEARASAAARDRSPASWRSSCAWSRLCSSRLREAIRAPTTINPTITSAPTTIPMIAPVLMELGLPTSPGAKRVPSGVRRRPFGPGLRKGSFSRTRAISHSLRTDRREELRERTAFCAPRRASCCEGWHSFRWSR
jgi:hypothetical protein